MWKWSVVIFIIAGVTFAIYSHRSSPYYNAPYNLVWDNGFLLASKNEGSLRAVLKGIPDERDSRRYFTYNAADVPSSHLNTWSMCRPPTEDEATIFAKIAELGPGERLDAICEIDANGDLFIRGWVTSVADL